MRSPYNYCACKRSRKCPEHEPYTPLELAIAGAFVAVMLGILAVGFLTG